MRVLLAPALQTRSLPLAQLGRVEAWLRYLYDLRRCWICGRCGLCSHREPAADLAELETMLKNNRRLL